MFSRALASIVSMLLVSIVLTAGADAAWIEDGNPVSTAAGSQMDPLIILDGEGGAFVAWTDYGTNEIFAQRLDAYGREMWTPGGVQVTWPGRSCAWPAIARCNEGGLLIAWVDEEGSDNDIYAQRINADGYKFWVASGAAVSTAEGNQGDPKIASDGAGGAVIVYESYSGTNYDIYAQRLESGGFAIWPGGGVAVCTESSYHQLDPRLVVDTANNYVYFAWTDFRDGGAADIYGHRYYLSSGTRGWAEDGVPLCSEANNQLNPFATLDRNSNLVVSWRDNRNYGRYGIYAQAFNSSATEQWTSGGIAVFSAAAGTADEYHMCADPDGGILVAWDDDRDGTYRSYAQKVTSGGSAAWTADGVSVCGLTGQTWEPRMATDGEGGALVLWRDHRYNGDLFMQRIDDTGALLWGSDGLKLTTAARIQYQAEVTHDGRGGAIAAWTDYRDEEYDVYAGRMDRSGNWGFPAPEITSVIDVPGDQGGCVSVAWDASYLDAWPVYEITEYSVWRAIDQPAAMALESGGAAVLTSAGDLDPEQIGRNHADDTGSRPGGDIIRREMLDGEPYYWMLVSTDPAFAQENYSDVIATLFDSTGVHHDQHYFQVIAHTGDRTVFWESLPDSGYSVDNLAPAMPLALAGEQMFGPDGLQLTWDPNTEPDLAGYHIYRGISSGFEPGPGSFVASTPDTATFDGDWDWAAGYWYKVAAVDIHGNESVFAVLGPDMLTGDDPMPAPDATFLAQNYPNPFNPSTTIRFGLKERGTVSLRIYDAAGRLMRTLAGGTMDAGRYELSWDGMDDSGAAVASGVYFYMLRTKEFEETRKMILLR